MTDKYSVKKQLQRVGADVRFWGRSEANELPNILFPEEQIQHALNGRYENGFALFCATNHRLLLLDKKPLMLSFEDMRYEMVSEVDYTEQLFSATLKLQTPSRTLRFRSFRISKLRNLTNYIQEEVSRFRDIGHESKSAQQQQAPLQPYSQYFQNATQADVSSYQQPDFPQIMHPSSPYRQQHLNMRRRVPKFTPPVKPSQT